MSTDSPTKITYNSLDDAYIYFNQVLFNGRLPNCLISLRPRTGSYGYYSYERFGVCNGDERRDEIALNIRRFRERSPEQILSTLVHEMVHLEQFHFGSPSRVGYHNSEWAKMMERVGLMPSSTGKPGGKRIGPHLQHYIIKDGPFDLAVKERTFVIPYYDRLQPSPAKRRITYTCPKCESKLFGKPNLHPLCGDCNMAPMTPLRGPPMGEEI